MLQLGSYDHGSIPDWLELSVCFRFVEMMVPVFTRKAWKCVWHMIQVPTALLGAPPSCTHVGCLQVDLCFKPVWVASDYESVFL